MNGSGSVPVAPFKHKCKMITALWAASSVIFELVEHPSIPDMQLSAQGELWKGSVE